MGFGATLLAMFTVHAWFRDDVNFTHGLARVTRLLAVLVSFFMLGFTLNAWWQVFVGIGLVYLAMTKVVDFVAGNPDVK